MHASSTALRTIVRSAAVVALLCGPGRAGAQIVLGPGADGTTLPRGSVRTTVGADHSIDRGRFNNGDAEPLGAAFSSAAFGVEQSSALAALASAFTAMGVPSLSPSLGATTLNLRQRIFTTRLGVEVGVFDWLTLGVEAPLVRTRAEALLRLNGAGATAGRNPIGLGSAVAAANGATISSYENAVAALTARRDDCIANAGSHPECGIILAESGSVTALNAMTTTFASRLGVAYGGTGYGGGLPFVPMAGSAGELALSTRADSLRTAFERYGVTDIDSTAMLPLGAQTPLTADDLALMVGAGFANGGGYNARPMTRTAFQQIGDVDISARVRLFDNLSDTTAQFAVRQTIGAVVRLGSGYHDQPDNFIDVGTGSGADGLGLRSFTDVRVREDIFATVVLAWSSSRALDRELRLPRSAASGWVEEEFTEIVEITPGSLLEIGLAPRWQLSRHFLLSAEWRWRSKAADEVTPVGGPVAVVLYGENFSPSGEYFVDAQAWSESRFAWSVSYSTLNDRSGPRRLPIEIGYTHEQTVSNSRGIVPQRFTDRIQIRYYTRFFGR